MKCIVRECPNRRVEGEFNGPICVACASALQGHESTPPASAYRIVLSVLSPMKVHLASEGRP